jgi:two-component system, response regulator PdtaR
MEPIAAESANSEDRRRRILLVEDDILIRSSAADYLRDTGFEVFEAVNAHEAMAILGAGTTIDAVFCDVNLASDIDGLAFSQWLAEHYSKLPIILTSGDRDAAALVKESPTLRFVVKPYVLSDIERRLRELSDGK